METPTFHARRVGMVFINFLNARIPRIDADFQGKDCVHKNPIRTISRIELGANNWVGINPILPKHAPVRDLKGIITLASRIEIGDYDPHSLVSQMTAGNVGSQSISLMSALEGEARNKTNIC